MQNPNIVRPWAIELSAELCKLLDMLGAKGLFPFDEANTISTSKLDCNSELFVYFVFENDEYQI